MLSPGDMFRSYGMIRVLVVEADEGRKISRPQCMADRFYVSISLTDDEESKTLVRFSTACYMFTPSRNSSSVNEEFIFDGVASTQSLVVSLNISSDSEVLSCQQTIIPVSRLEEDVEVSSFTSSANQLLLSML